MLRPSHENYKSARTEDFRVSALPTIPLIEELATSTIPPGSNIIVEYEPSSQWFPASITIAAGWLKQNGKVSYTALAQAPAKVRDAIGRFGIDCARLETGPQDNEPLRIWDYYTAALSVKSNEKLQQTTLKVSDISIHFIKEQFSRRPTPDRLLVVDDYSSYSRFNEEKSWVEFLLTRDFPFTSAVQSRNIGGLMKGMHGGWVYNRLEAAADGIVDFKLEEEGKSTRDLVRIRSMRNVHFDREWHELKIEDNFEVALEK
jgi:KaiC/GvpD/RAD55 family RecA-like ATPase